MTSPPIVCPFCPLHCDDIRADSDGNLNVECAIASIQLKAALHSTIQFRLGDDEVSEDKILSFASELVQKPAGRHITTGSTTLTVARVLSRLRDAGKIRLSVDATATQAAVHTAISRDGTITATLGDVKKHADMIWIIGNIEPQMPRLKERLGLPNTIVSQAGISVSDLGQLAYAIRSATAVDVPMVRAVAEKINASQYVAIVLADDAFDSGEALAAAELMIDLISLLNRPQRRGSRRAVLLSINALNTLRSVVGWRSNECLLPTDSKVAIRVGDPIGNPLPVQLQIGGRDPGKSLAYAHLPTTTAGVDETDVVIRGDGTVTLPLDAWAADEDQNRRLSIPQRLQAIIAPTGEMRVKNS